jgi:hypothetical protein
MATMVARKMSHTLGTYVLERKKKKYAGYKIYGPTADGGWWYTADGKLQNIL